MYKPNPASDYLVASLYPLHWRLTKWGLVRQRGQLFSPSPFMASSRGAALLPLWRPLPEVSLSSFLTQIHLIHPLSLHLNVFPAGESLLIHRNMQSPASMTFLFLRLVHLNPPLIKFFWAPVWSAFLSGLFFKYYFYFYTCLALSLSPLCNPVPASRVVIWSICWLVDSLIKRKSCARTGWTSLETCSSAS